MMTGKQLVEHAFRLEPVERIPWVPFVGVHGGTLIGTDAQQYLKSADLIVDGVSAAVEAYEPDGIPVIFDLQIEAEALGCELQWSADNPPSVVTHPLMDKKLHELEDYNETLDRLPLAAEATRRLREKYPNLALYGLITGPFTLALHLLGTDIFTQMMMQPDTIHDLLDFTRDIAVKTADIYRNAGADIIAVVDPMTSQIDPVSFEQFVTPPATQLFDHIHKQGALSSFFVCGHAQQNIEAMCKCRPDNISIDENIPLDYVREIALAHKISFGGNMRLTIVLLMGSEEDAQREAMDCIEAAGETGFILAPGCDLPMDTPPENLKAVTQLVRDPYRQDVVRALEVKQDADDLLNLQDYGNRDKVIVDIITLDSESCAPCMYMVEAVKQVAPQFKGIVEWREHSVKDVKAVTFMSSLYVKNIPTICIDGQIKFVSQIPPRNKLIEAIQERINEKLQYKVRVKKGELILLGNDPAECDELKSALERAQYELGTDLSVRCVTDANDIAAYGVTQTPALVTVNTIVKSQGYHPSVDVIKEWIKEIENI
ncbi:MAG: uroporphyrinogen decarboxylase family protein [candidate division KSB1 bacterium]|nr:uroporphyrinogen decarboxylase family protein [candidate division KSB1 bacterium]